eukprot:CAMPEP_0197173156 /NCGR_PEP_ID=MMETSP1423-20130617/186_1 /TAXON_ID=476441 /ORGANISM="Pseudo-nitzschia heimii, Strain UNC1101" /LENGTH=93 /DNA_ID=CAMNT_0042621923 /DNA_START=59 /DNA_END=337 /DNA_ORIENTATION=-
MKPGSLLLRILLAFLVASASFAAATRGLRGDTAQDLPEIENHDHQRILKASGPGGALKLSGRGGGGRGRGGPGHRPGRGGRGRGRGGPDRGPG